MASSHELGQQGEDMAAVYLLQKGYAVLERNWRAGKEEIDIIAQTGGWLVFVEVKTRMSSCFGMPECSVTRIKQRRMIHAANHYIRFNRCSSEARFDIISIIMNESGPELSHIEGAFYPTTN